MGGNPNAKRTAELNKALLACASPEVVASFTLQLEAARGGDHQAGQWLLNKLTGKAVQAVELSTANNKSFKVEASNTLSVVLAVLKNHPEVSHEVAAALQRATAPTIEAPTDGPGNGNGSPA